MFSISFGKPFAIGARQSLSIVAGFFPLTANDGESLYFFFD
jgi:hypothetical protein